jgi:uncharacterized membrane protein YhaH (DUF805 family)
VSSEGRRRRLTFWQAFAIAIVVLIVLTYIATQTLTIE